MRSLKEFLDKARKYAKEGKWEELDKKIVPEIISSYSHEEIVDYLPMLFSDESGDVRDLAGTIASELKVSKLSEDKKYELKELIRKGLKDPHIYARFRFAIAAVKHKLYEEEEIKEISGILEEVANVEKDEGIKNLAISYLKKLKK
jgi:hypothetical protein